MATNAFVELPPLKEAQTLADYTGVHHDLFSAREFATMLLEEYRQQNFRLADPLMVAIIIRYARSFKGGIRSRLPNAENVLTNGQLARHQYFLDVRDKFIAHSVNAFEECQPVARYWVESVESEGISSIECNYHRISGLSEDDLRNNRSHKHLA